jgi:hypothetical protein
VDSAPIRRLLSRYACIFVWYQPLSTNFQFQNADFEGLYLLPARGVCISSLGAPGIEVPMHFEPRGPWPVYFRKVLRLLSFNGGLTPPLPPIKILDKNEPKCSFWLLKLLAASVCFSLLRSHQQVLNQQRRVLLVVIIIIIVVRVSDIPPRAAPRVH